MNIETLKYLAMILTNLGDLKNLTKWQIMTLTGCTIGGALSGYALRSNWQDAVLGGVMGLATHLTGQVQHSPIEVVHEVAQAQREGATSKRAIEIAKEKQVEKQGSSLFDTKS